MFEVMFSDFAYKQLKGLDKKEQKHLITLLERVSIRPEKFLRKIVGDEGYTLRIEDYDVFIDVKEKDLFVLFGKKRMY